MEFLVKKTNELTQLEKKQICNLFFDVFEKEKTLESFDKQFLNTPKGYSYHGLIVNEDNLIVGCYSSIPMKYEYYNNNYVFGLSVDTMIREKYRGSPFNLKKIANLVYELMLKDDIFFVFGFPNDNVYLVRKKILKWKDIGQLDYFILPIKIGSIKPKLKIFNFMTILISKFMKLLSKNNFIFEGYKKNIEKLNNEDFFKYRYSLFSGSYKIIKYNEFYFTYKVDIYEGINAAYLIDVNIMCKQNFDYAVKYIIENEKNIDIILFVGKIDFKPLTLFKVPEKYIPKTVYMAGKILDEGKIKEDIFDINNWNVNLSNFDVL